MFRVTRRLELTASIVAVVTLSVSAAPHARPQGAPVISGDQSGAMLRVDTVDDLRARTADERAAAAVFDEGRGSILLLPSNVERH